MIFHAITNVLRLSRDDAVGFDFSFQPTPNPTHLLPPLILRRTSQVEKLQAQANLNSTSTRPQLNLNSTRNTMRGIQRMHQSTFDGRISYV